MINFRRLSKYLLAYVILLIIAAVFTVEKIIRPIDLAVYKEYYLKSELVKNYKDEFLNKEIDIINKKINEKIIFIDIPTENWPKGTFLKNLRSHEADLLKTIDSMVSTEMPETHKPIIILDVTFKSESVGLDLIEEAIWPLFEKDIKIYAPYRLPVIDDDFKFEDIKFEDHDEKQAYYLYDDFFTSGRLNTQFYNHEKVNGLVTYYSFEVLNDTIIKSLPVQVVEDLDLPNQEKVDLRNQKIYPLPLKLPFDPSSIEDNYYVFTNDSSFTAFKNFSKLKDSINLLEKIIIIGTPEDKIQIGDSRVPGPYVVATALIDQLNGNKFTKRSHEDMIVQLVLIFFFAFFVCLFFAVIYKYIKKLQTRPAIIAFISWILGVLLLISTGYLLLENTIIRPAFPALSMLFVAVLAWHFTKKFLVTGVMDGGEVYDVFISYSFGDGTWVKEKLYNPLKEFQKPDGNKLKIFFAEKSIGIGELFTTKYMRAIVDSKLFVPVMSEEYYNKNHCRNEMDLGFKRHVEKLMNMCIIAIDYKYVPEEFTNINFVDITKQTNFMSTLKKEIFRDEINELVESITDEKLELVQQGQKENDKPEPIEQEEICQEESIQHDKPDTIEKVELDQRDQKQDDKPDTVEILELDQQESKPADKPEMIEVVELDQQQPKQEEKKKKVKKDKKDKKEQKKKVKKRSKKKDKKEQKKKSKKRSEKKDKKEQKKKSKKPSEKKDKKEQKKKSKKNSDRKVRKKNNKKS